MGFLLWLAEKIVGFDVCGRCLKKLADIPGIFWGGQECGTERFEVSQTVVAVFARWAAKRFEFPRTVPAPERLNGYT